MIFTHIVPRRIGRLRGFGRKAKNLFRNFTKKSKIILQNNESLRRGPLFLQPERRRKLMGAHWEGSERRSEPRLETRTPVRLTANGLCMGEGVTKDCGSKSLYAVLRCADYRLQKDTAVEVLISEVPGETPKKMEEPLKATIVRMESRQTAGGIALVFPQDIRRHIVSRAS